MKTTFRLMGIADWVTLGNGLLGTLSIVFLILAFDGFASVDDSHLSDYYIWLAMLFILLSVIGDIIDGPIARRYSKRRYLGSYLDLMSDSISLSENINPYIISSVLFLIGIPWILIIRIKSQRNLIIF